MDGRAVARAIDAARRGWPVAVTGAGATLGVLAVETADAATLAEVDYDAAAGLLLSGERAATLRLANQRNAADPAQPVMIERAAWLDLPAALAVADPARDLDTPLKGPFRSVAIDRPELAVAAIELMRLAGLLPAAFAGVRTDADDARCAAAAIMEHEARPDLAIVARARLPVAAHEACEIVGFRHRESGEEHVALIIGQPDGNPPLVRLHSECLTGDVFGSMKCDCGPQLSLAIAAMAKAGWGILLYVRQEGRGIGLINKLRAYSLQDQGFDTVDANLRLGFAVDARDYSRAAAMLRLIGQHRVRLMTNNPDKVARLAAAGITVTERVAHSLPANPHNAAYLGTKRDRTGHQL